MAIKIRYRTKSCLLCGAGDRGSYRCEEGVQGPYQEVEVRKVFQPIISRILNDKATT